MKNRQAWMLACLCLLVGAGPAWALPRTGAYVSLSPSSPRVMVVVTVYDGALEVTYIPRHMFDGIRNQYALVGSLRSPLKIVEEHDEWPAVTALLGYQRQQGGIGNATNAVEYGFKVDKSLFPWMSVHGLFTNASVVHASTPQGTVGRDLLVMPRIEIGVSFHPMPPVYFHVGFVYWTGPAEINTPTTFMRGTRGYPGFLLGVNWQLSDLFGLPEPGQEAPPSPSPSPRP